MRSVQLTSPRYGRFGGLMRLRPEMREMSRAGGGERCFLFSLWSLFGMDSL
jgi:hypothetical protein